MSLTPVSKRTRSVKKVVIKESRETMQQENQQTCSEHEYRKDWWEVEPKTGYTYVETASYSPRNPDNTWVTPNMSRPALLRYSSSNARRHTTSSIMDSSSAATTSQAHREEQEDQYSHLNSSPMVTAGTSTQFASSTSQQQQQEQEHHSSSQHWQSSSRDEQLNISNSNRASSSRQQQYETTPNGRSTRKGMLDTSAHGDFRHVLRSGNRYGMNFESPPQRKESLHVSFEDEVDSRQRTPPGGRKYVLRAPLYGPDGDDDDSDTSSDVIVYGSRSSTFTVVESTDRITLFWRTVSGMWNSSLQNSGSAFSSICSLVYFLTTSLWQFVTSSIVTILATSTALLSSLVGSVSAGAGAVIGNSMDFLSRNLYSRTINTVITESWSLLSWLGIVDEEEEVGGRGRGGRRKRQTKKKGCCGLPLPCCCCLLLLLPLLLLLAGDCFSDEDKDGGSSLFAMFPIIGYFSNYTNTIWEKNTVIIERGSGIGGMAGGSKEESTQPVVGGIALSAEELDARIRAIVNQVYRDYDRQHTMRYESAVSQQQQQLDALALSVKQQLDALAHEQAQSLHHQQAEVKLQQAGITAGLEAKISGVTSKSNAMLQEIEGLRAEIARGDSINDDRLDKLAAEVKHLQNYSHLSTLIRKEIDSRLTTMLMGCTGSTACEADSVWSPFAAWLQDKINSKDADIDSRINALAMELNNKLAYLNKTCCKDDESLAALFAATAASQTSSSFFCGGSSSTDEDAAVDVGLTMKQSDKVSALIHDALLLYSADKTGLVDYALESGGGTVVSIRCTETYSESAALLSMFGIPIMYVSNSPRTVIQPGVQRGECWPFKGSVGFVVIRLAMPIHPTSFTMEHLPRHMSPDGHIKSAPRDFAVLGLLSEHDPNPVPLGNYTYQQDGEPLQNFPVQAATLRGFQLIELQILKNWGHMKYTCLYRFRVHGKKMELEQE